jgi:hypothetical protein
MSEILVNTIKKADGTGSITVPANTGTLVDTSGATFTGAVTGTDLTLSGGVYLGGTVAANYLDDYEEGDWTPTGNNITYSSVDAHYVKLGKIVYVGVKVSFPSTSNGSSAQIRDLPFTVGSNDASRCGLAVGFSNVGFVVTALGNDGGTQIVLRDWNGNNITNSALSGAAIFVGGWYSTA